MNRIWERSGVYKITNISNGKIYIGSASKNFSTRWALHRSELRKGIHSNSYLQRSWNKYGESSFMFEVVEYCDSDICVTREQYWIDELRSTDRGIGYNLSPTAGSTLGVKHSPDAKTRVKSEEHKKKIGDGRRGKKWTEEAKSAANAKRQPLSLDRKIKLRLGQMNKIPTPKPQYVKEKSAAKHRGMKRSEEAKRNMSEAQLKRFAKERENG